MKEAILADMQSGYIIPINKPVFRLGREASYVDLTLQSPTVSRSHCDILTRDDGYWIVDRNSVNRTSVDNVVLTPNQEYKLTNHAMIRVADMLFLFLLREPEVS